ncbi:MAG TPA: MFS transporter [Chloroflexia bacterium]|nr:MFS transporter [Chloroflexia bacterium]
MDSNSRTFNIVWAGQTLSILGDTFAFVAVPLLVLQATGSIAQMGLITGIFGIGQLAAGLVAGLLVDRWDRRWLLIGCDCGRALLYGAIPLLWGHIGPQIALLYLVAGLGGFLGNTFQIGLAALLPNLVDRTQLTAANSRLQISIGVAFLLGPLLAGLVSQGLGGPAIAIGVDALSFLASVLSLWVIRLPIDPLDPREPQPGTAPADLLAGVRFLIQAPQLRVVSLFLAASLFLTAPVPDLFIYRLKHDLGAGDSGVGLVLGFAALGAIGAGVVAAGVRRRWGFGIACWGGGGLIGAALAPIGFQTTLPAIAGLALVAFFGSTLRDTVALAFRQEVTPDALLGRLTAAASTLNLVLGSLGAAVLTGISAYIGTPLTLLIIGGGLLLLALGFGTPLGLRQIGHQEQDPAQAG